MDRTQPQFRSTFFYGMITSLYSLSDKMYGSAFIVIMGMMKLSPEEIASLFAISSITMAIFDYPSGHISDKYGRKRLTALGAGILGFGIIGYGVAQSYTAFVVATITLSIGLALFSGSPQAWYVERLKALDQLAYKDIALPKLSAVASVFGIIGAGLASLIMAFSVPLCLLVGGGIIVVSAASFFFAGEENYGSAAHEPIVAGIVGSTKRFIANQQLMVILFRNILSHVGFLIFIMSWQLYGLQSMGIQSGHIGLIMILFMAVISASGFMAAKGIRVMGGVKTSMLAALFKAVGFCIVFASNGWAGYLLGICFFEVGFGLELSAYGTWIHDFITDDNRATFYSGMNALKSLAGFFMTLAIGFMTAALGYKVMWLVAAAFEILSIAGLLWVEKVSHSADKLLEKPFVDIH